MISQVICRYVPSLFVDRSPVYFVIGRLIFFEFLWLAEVISSSTDFGLAWYFFRKWVVIVFEHELVVNVSVKY